MALWMNVPIWGPARGVRWLQIMRPMEGGMMINPSSFFLFLVEVIGVVGGWGFLFLCATFVVRFYGVYGYLCDSEGCLICYGSGGRISLVRRPRPNAVC